MHLNYLQILFYKFYQRVIAIDSNRNPHIAYGEDHLYHAYHDGSNWQYETVDTSSGVGNYASIAIDSLDKVHISCYDATNGNLKYATNASGSWVTQIVDSIRHWRGGVCTSIAVDLSYKIHISFYDHQTYFGTGYLKYATNTSGSWSVEILDSNNSLVGYTSIAIDSLDNVHISYYYDIDADLKYQTNASGTWITETVDSDGSVGAYNSIALDSSNNVHISYRDYSNYDLKYATNILDTDGDGIFDDGDGSGVIGDNPCTGGNTLNCDDNCIDIPNPDQADADSDGVGDVCDINIPPIANPNGPYTATEGQAITLDGSGSNDPDGSITLYEWDIDNDGIYEYNSSLPTRNHTYTQQGAYTIKLRVTDNRGATDEATTTATVSDTAPIASFTGTPTSGIAPLTVTFTNSSTGYDQPLTYAWDFDNDGTVDSTLQGPQYTYSNPGTYTVTLTVTDSDGSIDTLTRTDYITVTPPFYTLTVNTTGSGGGTVTSSPSGINCGIDCTEAYSVSTVVTLTATPTDGGSTFVGWSGGGCSGTGDCIITMNADTTVTATFDACTNPPVRIGGTYYTTLQAAYDTAVDGNIIQSQNIVITENLNLNLNKSVTLEGGYDCDYTIITGQTIFNGNITISNGTATIENFILE